MAKPHIRKIGSHWYVYPGGNARYGGATIGAAWALYLSRAHELGRMLSSSFHFRYR